MYIKKISEQGFYGMHLMYRIYSEINVIFSIIKIKQKKKGIEKQ